MIDYCIKMPENDEYEKGHKYPYYSCELLCSMNGLNIDKLLKMPNNDLEKKEEINVDPEENENKEEEKEKEKIENNNMNSDKDNVEATKKMNNNEKDENSEKMEIFEDKDNVKEEETKKLEEEKMEIEEEENEIDSKTLKEKHEDITNISLVNSILDHLFSFLKEKSSLDNYVLMGYFNKIVNYLIKTKTKIILDYILINRENTLNLLLSHINRYSIANIIINLLNALSEDNTPEANDKYMLIVNKLIDQLNIKENDYNSIDIICELMISCIIYNNKIKLSKTIDANIITKFENIIQKYFENYKENKDKIMSILNLLNKMNKSILSNFSNKITTTKNIDDNKIEMMNLIKLADKSNNQFTSLNNSRFDFKELVYKSFQNNYQNYLNSITSICINVINNLNKRDENKQEIIFSYCNKIQIFGINKITEFEFIITVLDLCVNCLGIYSEDEKKNSVVIEKIEQILKTNIFKLMIEYYFKYRNNNFYSNIMLDLIKIIFDNDKAPEDLILNILQINIQNETINENNYINLLTNDLMKNVKFTFENSNNTMNDLLFGINVTILNYIFTCKNKCMNKIYEKMQKEKIFYENFVKNINYIFSKRLYKIDDNTDKPQFDLLGVRIGSSDGSQGKSDIPFSLESLNELINFYLKIYEKYLAGEEYMSLFKERENKLEEIKKSNEYIRLGNQSKDEESETEEEDDEYDDVDIPKPKFFNSKLDTKKDDEIKKEIKDNQEKNINDEINTENKEYNDVNFWHAEIKEENMDEILKELL